jgi:poly(A) polymerase
MLRDPLYQSAPMATLDSLAYSPHLDRLRQIIPSKTQVYLVGGAVRDSLLNLTIHDMDFVVDEDSIKVARRVADVLQAAFFPLDSERDTGRVIVREPGGKRLILDFSLQRGPDLESDLRARDFTVNAMAMDLRAPQTLIDPLGGARDLLAKHLRVCSTEAFSSDPVRIVRGVRLASTFELRLDADTLQLMRASIPALTQVSIERMRDELFRILENPQPKRALHMLDYLEVLSYILPELSTLRGFAQPAAHTANAWEHTLNVLQSLDSIVKTLAIDYDPNSSANLFMGLVSLKLGRYREQLHAHLNTLINPDRSLRGLLFLAALYHDVANPQARPLGNAGRLYYCGDEEQSSQSVARRARLLHLSNEETERLASIVQNYLTPVILGIDNTLPDRRMIYRFFMDAGSAGIDACFLSLADVIATYGPGLSQDLWAHHLDVVRILLEAWWDHQAEMISPPTLINGNVLMENLGIHPGPEVGKILEAIREAQAIGRVNTRDQALMLARSIRDRGE